MQTGRVVVMCFSNRGDQKPSSIFTCEKSTVLIGLKGASSVEGWEQLIQVRHPNAIGKNVNFMLFTDFVMNYSLCSLAMDDLL